MNQDAPVAGEMTRRQGDINAVDGLSSGYDQSQRRNLETCRQTRDPGPQQRGHQLDAGDVLGHHPRPEVVQAMTVEIEHAAGRSIEQWQEYRIKARGAAAGVHM